MISFTITNIIVLVTVLVSIAAESNYALKERLIFNPYAIDRYKQYYRFISAGFIHQGYLHLGFNMLALYSFGNLVERNYMFVGKGFNGQVLYLLLYFVGMIVAHLPAFLKHRNHSYYNALGASGAVSAVVFAGIMFYPTQQILVFFIPMPGFIFGALYLFYSFYQSRYGNDNIGHDAHFFGALFGIIFTIAIYPPVLEIFIDSFRNYHLPFLPR